MSRPSNLLATLLITLSSTAVLSADPLPASSGFGLDGMAPAGHWAARLTLLHNGYTEKFDNQGRTVDFDTGVNGVALDSAVFPALAAFGSGATLGTVALDTRISTAFTELMLGYGVTENLTAGFILPWAQTRTKARFSVNGGNVGFNPTFNPALPIDMANFPFAPVGGSITPLGTAGVQELLTNPAFGYAYQPITSTTTSGFSDPTVGALWRFHRSEKESAVLGMGVRFGVADEDDPDNLLDVPVSGGATTLRTRLEYFRDLGAGFDLRLMAEHLAQLPDEIILRIPAPGALLAPAASKEKLKRNLGDYQEYDVELGYSWGDWRTSATWHRYQKPADKYVSRLGTNTAALEANTETLADQLRIGVTWSGVKAWQAGKIPLPLIVKLEMQDAFDGQNFVKVRDFYLRVTSFF